MSHNQIRNYINYIIIFMLIAVVILAAGCASKPPAQDGEKIPVKVLILPKFEEGEITGDAPGEGQYYYDEYCKGGEEYDIRAGYGDGKVYYKDGVALCLAGQGKVCATLTLTSLMTDDRFDFSDAYIVATGCAGAASDYGIMGDVFVITSAVDYDLGHHSDWRELEEKREETWFHNESYDATSKVVLNEDLTDRVFDLVKDVKLETTDRAVEMLHDMFPGEKWIEREPMVQKGTGVTGDNFWKGEYDHKNALKIVKTYKCKDPFATTDMEDVAVALTCRHFGMLDKLIIIRDAVNMDVFPPDISPEDLWEEQIETQIAEDDNSQTVGMFPVSMKNNFTVGSVVIDAILNGEL